TLDLGPSGIDGGEERIEARGNVLAGLHSNVKVGQGGGDLFLEGLERRVEGAGEDWGLRSGGGKFPPSPHSGKCHFSLSSSQSSSPSRSEKSFSSSPLGMPSPSSSLASSGVLVALGAGTLEVEA